MISNHVRKESREFIKGIYVFFDKEGEIDEAERQKILDVLEQEGQVQVTEAMRTGMIAILY